MIDRKISVHLQDFPEVSFLKDEAGLVADMDLVRAVCSVALSIRDNKNLRVRLPLNQMTVIGKNAARILAFKDIIADEVNVKNIEVKEEISEIAELKLQVNFKKIGAKFGSKVKEITAAVKSGDWKKISEKEIEVAGVKLVDDEFDLRLTTKNQDEKKFVTLPLPTNDYLVQLDVEITKDLEDEGIARDIVRALQQKRKDENFDIANRKIKFKVFSHSPRILEVVTKFKSYIIEQVLAEELNAVESENEVSAAENFSETKLDDGVIFVSAKSA